VLHWRVQPDDRTESMLEVWMPSVAPQPNIPVEVISPAGQTSTVIAPGMWNNLTSGTNVIGRVANYLPGIPHNRCRIFINLAPTASNDGPIPVAPSGLWSVVLRNAGARPVRDIHAWIQRDDSPYGYPRRGRQSYFDDPNYHRFNVFGREIERDQDDSPAAYVRRDGSISGMATGRQPIVIGGYRRSRDGHPLKYSAGGPLIAPGRYPPSSDGPDAMAASEDSIGCHGVMAAGSRSGAAVAMRGTSLAAAIVTRIVATDLLAGQLADRQAVYNRAQADEGTAPQWLEPVPSPERGGGGRLRTAPVAPLPPIRRVDN
jgi:hypothetical protein